MTRPRLLDLFCGAGGAGMGYHLAGFEVIGVDIEPQPRYPFEFHQADALTFPLDGFDVIHASPPCQDYSRAMRHMTRKQYPRLIDAVLERLTNKHYIIENVEGSPIPSSATLFGEYGLRLCGSMFGLRVRRHRLFRASFPLTRPLQDCNHRLPLLNPYRGASRIRDGLQRGSMKAYMRAMGIDWMRHTETSEAIPPAYTRFIGEQAMRLISAQRMAAGA